MHRNAKGSPWASLESKSPFQHQSLPSPHALRVIRMWKYVHGRHEREAPFIMRCTRVIWAGLRSSPRCKLCRESRVKKAHTCDLNCQRVQGKYLGSPSSHTLGESMHAKTEFYPLHRDSSTNPPVNLFQVSAELLLLVRACS